MVTASTKPMQWRPDNSLTIEDLPDRLIVLYSLLRDWAIPPERTKDRTMTRTPSLPSIALFSLFVLGFALALLSAVIEPRTAEIMAWAAVACGVFAVACFGFILGETMSR
jgi:hypothetical protein